MFCPIVELTMQLIRCPSLSPNDEGCQELMIERLCSIGFTIEKMDFGDTKNFWAWRGQGETLVFAGHTDVAPVGNINHWIYHPFEPIIHNGILFGRGASDMKGSLAAMIIATERFVLSYPNHNGRLAFLVTSDEEASAKNGTVKVIKELTARNEHIHYCLIGEPSSIKTVGDVIKNGRRGSLTCELTIHGIQGHVAYPDLADNPIHHAIPTLNELIEFEWDHGNEFFPPTSMQITNIRSGTGSNGIIPGDLLVQFNFRFGTESTDSMIKTRVKSILEKYQLNYTINWYLSGQPFLSKKGKLLDAVVNSIIDSNAIEPKILTIGGTSDGRFITKIGAQVLELGLTNSTIHKVNECVDISDLRLLARIYQRIIESLII